MWIESLPPDKARSIFGDAWREIVTMTQEVAAGRRPTRPDGLSPEDYEGALYLYGINGPSVYLFLQSWQQINRPGGIVPAAASEQEIIKIDDRMSVLNPAKSPRWRGALREAGYQHTGDTLTHVWQTGMKVGLEVGSHIMKMLAGASAGELAQMPHNDHHFFLAMIPWARAGQIPCAWDDASYRLIVDWIDPEEIPALIRTEPYKENLWPTTGVGLRVRDEEAFGRSARESDRVILVCDASPARLQYIGRPGFRPRPSYLKGVTRQEPPHTGLIAAPANVRVPAAGFTIADESEGRLIRDQAGHAFYEGYTLQGVYDFDTGRDAYTEAFRHEMNRRLGNDLIQEGPYDTLAIDGTGTGWRLPFPVTAFLPDRAPVRLATMQEVQAFYEAFDIEWDDVYPDDSLAGG